MFYFLSALATVILQYLVQQDSNQMPHSAMLKSGPGLYEFLIEAELQQYYSTIKNDLKVFLWSSSYC